MIAIKSNKEIYFPDGKGFVTMKIDLIQNIPDFRSYTMRLEDTCTKKITEEGITKEIRVGNPRVRFKTMSYDELDILYDSLDMDEVDLPMRKKIDESFRQGLLAVTQKECVDGVYGDPGKGQYNSEAQDWEIVRKEGSDDKFVDNNDENKSI